LSFYICAIFFPFLSTPPQFSYFIKKKKEKAKELRRGQEKLGPFNHFFNGSNKRYTLQFYHFSKGTKGGGGKKMDSPHDGSPTGFHTLVALVHVPGDILWEFAGLITCT